MQEGDPVHDIWMGGRNAGQDIGTVRIAKGPCRKRGQAIFLGGEKCRHRSSALGEVIHIVDPLCGAAEIA